MRRRHAWFSLLAAAAAVTPMACGSSESSSPLLDPCSLLSTSDFTAAYGATFTTGSEVHLSGQTTARECRWNSPDLGPAVFVALRIVSKSSLAGSASPPTFKSIGDFYQSLSSQYGQVEQLSGIGDHAFYASAAHVLVAEKGNYLLSLSGADRGLRGGHPLRAVAADAIKRV